MKILEVPLLLILAYSCVGLVPERLSTSIYEEIMEDMNDIHFFVINSQLVSQQLITHFDHYAEHDAVKLFQCDPTDRMPFCSIDVPLYLIMNSIKIKFNGRQDHPDDLKKWIQYRINQHPDRMHSIEDLKEEARQKFQVFCYVDREGEAISKKERIFLAVAKAMHFLHFCYLDASIGKELGLKEGHLALVRRNMTTTLDWRSENTHEDDTEILYTSWMNYLINSFANDFRIEGKHGSQDRVQVECDLSLECEDQMSSLLLWEKVWRYEHEDLNFAINLDHLTKGYGHKSDNSEYDFPAFKYIVRTTTQRYEEEDGGSLLKYIDTNSVQWLATGIRIGENSVNELLKLKEENKLEMIREKTSTMLEPISVQDAHKYKHLVTPEEKLDIDDL